MRDARPHPGHIGVRLSAYRPDVREMAHPVRCPRCGVAVFVADDDNTLVCARCDTRFAIPPREVRALAVVSPPASPGEHALPTPPATLPAGPPETWSLVPSGTGMSELRVVAEPLLGVVGGTLLMLITMALQLDGLIVGLALVGPISWGAAAEWRAKRRANRSREKRG